MKETLHIKKIVYKNWKRCAFHINHCSQHTVFSRKWIRDVALENLTDINTSLTDINTYRSHLFRRPCGDSYARLPTVIRGMKTPQWATYTETLSQVLLFCSSSTVSVRDLRVWPCSDRFFFPFKKNHIKERLKRSCPFRGKRQWDLL